MRLRLFMENPDQPIPDAPKDWMPPMPRPETPPAEEESDHDSDAVNEVSHLGDGDETDFGVFPTPLLLLLLLFGLVMHLWLPLLVPTYK